MPFCVRSSFALSVGIGDFVAHLSDEEIRSAREIDLLSYLQSTAPQELVSLGNGNYCTREHDSLKISNGKWHWFSQGVGGKSAIDYLIKVKDFDFADAVRTVLGVSCKVVSFERAKAPTQRRLLLPERNESSEAVKAYLLRRGISEIVIDFCLKEKLLYESKPHHNAVFVGYDKAHTPRYAAIRGTGGSYKIEAPGSDKHFSFQLSNVAAPRSVHLFEAAIDALSYATLMELYGVDWKNRSLLSLAGVYQAKRDNSLPAALERFLADHPSIHTIYLHLDNDEAGRGAAASLVSGLKEKYEVVDAPSPEGKDINDYLLIQRKAIKEKEDHER